MSETAEIPLAERLTSAEREISRLSAQVKDLTEALRPFADALHKLEHELQLSVPEIYEMLAGTEIRESDLRKALSVIEAEIKGK